MNIQDWFPLGLTGLISLQSKGLSKVFSSTTIQKHQLIVQRSAFFMVQLSHMYRTPGKITAATKLKDIYSLENSYNKSSSVQSLSRVRLFATPRTAARQASLSNTSSQSLPKPMSIELVIPSNHLILCHPLLLLPSIFPSIRVFYNESALCIRWPKYWSFSFNISPSNEHPGLISVRMDWLDLLAVQGTLKSLLQYHSSKTSILQRSAFFIVQLSHPYMTRHCIKKQRHYFTNKGS